MQTSRDSSIWRSLAVAFGDGVAFGVGVKLAQGPNRPVATGPAPVPQVPQSVAGRLEQMEQRLSSIEQTPPPAAAPAPAPFDQKVLEAVVNALDARLHEQASQIERRLTELEAKIAIDLKTLERQDNAIVTGLQKRLEEVHEQYNEHVIAIRDAVAQDMDILYGQIAKVRDDSTESMRQALGEGLDKRIAAAVTAQVVSLIESRLGPVENRIESQVVEAADRAARQASQAESTRLEEQIAQIRVSLADKDREIAALRQRVEDADQSVLDMILAMGQMCRQVAERIAAPAPAAGPAPTAPPSDPQPPADSAPPSPPAGDAPTTGDPHAEAFADVMEALTAVSIGATNGHAAIEAIPPASANRTSRLWRIPLVSSFVLLAARSLHLMR
jgi:hypothetical protein